MKNQYLTTMRIISAITLAAFILTQAGTGYALRIKQARGNGVGDEIKIQLGARSNASGKLVDLIKIIEKRYGNIEELTKELEDRERSIENPETEAPEEDVFAQQTGGIHFSPEESRKFAIERLRGARILLSITSEIERMLPDITDEEETSILNSNSGKQVIRFVNLGIPGSIMILPLRKLMFEIHLLGSNFRPNELKKYKPDIDRVRTAAGENAPYLFEFGLPAVKHLITNEESLNRIGDELIRLGVAAGEQAQYLYKILFLVKSLITDEESFNQIGNDLLQILPLCSGVEIETYNELETFYFTEFLSLTNFSFWKNFVKPIIFNQTQGSFLCFRAIKELYDLGAITNEDDLTFIRGFIEKYGIRAYDLLENFLIRGVEQGIMAKPISREADLINEFLNKIPYAIIEIYEIYKLDPSKINEVSDRCKVMQKDIVQGDATNVEKDPLFSAMLMYIFPPAVTTQREQYFNLYMQRPDRASDTQAVPASLQYKEYFVSTGSYILKNPAKPLDQTPWSTLVTVIKKVNEEQQPQVTRQDIVDLGLELLSIWQTGNLASATDENRLKRQELLEKLYRYMRVSRGQKLPESLTTMNDIMSIKQFMGDTLRDLINECIAAYQKEHPEDYQNIINDILKIRNPKAKAGPILAVLNRFREDPQQVKERLSSILNIEDIDIIDRLWEDLRDKTSMIEVTKVLGAINFTIQPGKEATIISHQLQGSEYKAMQSEITTKYEFNQSREKLQLRFVTSKRKAHGVAGLNMGVCVAPDEKLWNNPNFMNVIIFNESGVAQGGMHVLIIKDNGKKYLVLPGINPSINLLTQVAGDDIYNQLISYAAELAQALQCSAVIIPTDATIHSNCSEIQRVISAKGYKELSLSKVYPFSYEPAYSFQKCFLVKKIPIVSATEVPYETYEPPKVNPVNPYEDLLDEEYTRDYLADTEALERFPIDDETEAQASGAIGQAQVTANLVGENTKATAMDAALQQANDIALVSAVKAKLQLSELAALVVDSNDKRRNDIKTALETYWGINKVVDVSDERQLTAEDRAIKFIIVVNNNNTEIYIYYDVSNLRPIQPIQINTDLEINDKVRERLESV